MVDVPVPVKEGVGDEKAVGDTGPVKVVMPARWELATPARLGSLFGIAVYRRAHSVGLSATLISSARPNFSLWVKSVIGVKGVPARRWSVWR
jgi:hypothetical protein